MPPPIYKKAKMRKIVNIAIIAILRIFGTRTTVRNLRKIWESWKILEKTFKMLIKCARLTQQLQY